MKLAEALILRADTQNRLYALRDRLHRSGRVQEGEQPPEPMVDLLTELNQLLKEFTRLVQSINYTNTHTAFDDTLTLSDALASRDTLKLHIETLRNLIQTSSHIDFRQGRSEIKVVPTFNIADMQKEASNLSRELRELDTRIQQFNWNTDLVER